MELLGWKPATSKAKRRCAIHFGRPYGPNLADLNNTASAPLIAGRTYEILDVPADKIVNFAIADLEEDEEEGDSTLEAFTAAQGTVLERGLQADLEQSLDEHEFHVSRTAAAHSFSQYRHLQLWEAAIANDPEACEKIYAAGDYAVKTDVMVGVDDPGSPGEQLLHAAVSSKLTLRSDRAQNVRTEFNVLVRNRRGRTPHLVVVTAEPHPGRLISLTRGTGEIDTTYHLLFEPISQAIGELVRRQDLHAATKKSLRRQADTWTEMVKGSWAAPI